MADPTRTDDCDATDDGWHCLMKMKDGTYVCAPCGAVLDTRKGHHLVCDLTVPEARTS